MRRSSTAPAEPKITKFNFGNRVTKKHFVGTVVGISSRGNPVVEWKNNKYGVEVIVYEEEKDIDLVLLKDLP